MIHGLGLIREKSDRPSALTYLPPGLFTMAALLALLQPEFNLAEVSTIVSMFRDLVRDRQIYWYYFLQLWESFVLLLSDHSHLPVEIALAAW